MKFNHYLSLLTGAVAITLSSCGGSPGTVDYIPVKIDSKEAWGFVGPDGNTIFTDEFEKCPSLVVNGYFTVSEGDAVCVYQVADKPKLVNGLDDLRGAGTMAYDRMPIVRPESRIEIVDGSGKTISTLMPVDGVEIRSTHNAYSDGLLIFTTDKNLDGAVDLNGNVVIKPTYFSISDFVDGYSVASYREEAADSVEVDEYTYRYEIIDKKGKVVYKLPKDMQAIGGYTKSGLVIVSKGEKYGFINKDGEYRAMPSKVEGIFQVEDNIFGYYHDGKFGVMNLDKEDVIRAKYDNLTILSKNRFLVSRDDKWSIIDDKDERIVKFSDVLNVRPLYTDFDSKFQLIAYNEDRNYVLLNYDGEQIGKEEFESLDWDSHMAPSDYFDMEAATKSIISGINSTGYDKAAIGEPMSKLLTGSPSDYAYTSQIELASEYGYKYNYSVYASPSEAITLASPVYTTQYYFGYAYNSFDHYDYSFNPDSKLESISVNVEFEKKLYQQFREELDNQLASKSIKYVEKEPSYAVYALSSNVRMCVIPAYGLKGAEIIIASAAEIQNQLTYLKSRAQDRFND